MPCRWVLVCRRCHLVGLRFGPVGERRFYGPITMDKTSPLLVVGEIVIDFTIPSSHAECKMRLGGIVHAARGLWAAGIEYAVAAICPKYLVEQAKNYLEQHGCKKFIWIGEVLGAPNVIMIVDAKEVSSQGYEDLLRDEKTIKIPQSPESLEEYTDILIFPGRYDLDEIYSAFSGSASFTFDMAYDISDIAQIEKYNNRTTSIIISTSSPFFQNNFSHGIDGLLYLSKKSGAKSLLLKENRGGSRIFDLRDNETQEIPAILGVTSNSVGVGDVYSAVFAALQKENVIEAAWRGARAATYYSQTTFPDDFRRDVQRDLKLSLQKLQGLGGTILPWHERQKYPIYLAAPDFSYIHKPEIDSSVDALKYHNFTVRRPIIENGELDLSSGNSELLQTYNKDLALLHECAAVFAVPLKRDPGTLVEVGYAIALGKPVVTFDPRHENRNTMVMAGSQVYSDDLDICINGLFDALSDLRKERK